MAQSGMHRVREEPYLKHDLQERVTHWIHLINVVFLVLSGFQLHSPSFNVFGTMAHARYIHVLSGYLFLFIGIIHIYFFFATGKWRIAMPVFSDIPQILPTVKYYLFLTPEKPDYVKYNPLQKGAYALLFVVSFLQALLGFALYWPGIFEGFVYALGGIMAVKARHLLVTWVFVAFTSFHVYLVFSEDWRLLIALITGYYRKKVPVVEK